MCKICSSEIGHVTKDGKEANLALDHCHISGKIRGLLCNRCNRGLGFFEQEDPTLTSEVLESALRYINQQQTV